MERINNAFNKVTNTNKFRKQYEDLKKEVLNDEQIRLFLNENSSQITEEMLDKSLMKLYEFTSQSKQCQKCPSLGECVNLLQGFHPKLVIRRNMIDLNYEDCPRKVMDDKKRKLEKLIQSFYVPKDILAATMEDFYRSDASENRIDAVEKAMAFIMDYKPGEKQKSLYLYGEFGVGKTYLLGAIANELAKKEISSLLIYVPDFLRELKGSFTDNTFNDKIDMAKKAPVLMFDDIGSESMTSWGRDEVIGPILQFRMLENLPTFFTSNFNFVEMQTHLTFSQRGEKEEVKAARVMERIKYLAEPFLLKGKNRRH
ncbi:primosomal protein DnaI [Bacillus cihuensis]|uniref:primosomal protein DnaI n=1 Tax=Bacillus cihuensis TaxID=1208599 RepID=UPI0004025FC2|nr:primosomal protein DnaI [Bacillus cihuensis]